MLFTRAWNLLKQRRYGMRMHTDEFLLMVINIHDGKIEQDLERVGEITSIWTDGMNYRGYPPKGGRDLSTFRECVDTTVTATEVAGKKALLVEMVVWRGDSFNGARQTRKAEVSVPLFYLPKSIVTDIHHMIRGEARDQYEREERLKEEERVKEIYDQLMEEASDD
jgi:hypothetical protein